MSVDSPREGISRRDFLKGAAFLIASPVISKGGDRKSELSTHYLKFDQDKARLARLEETLATLFQQSPPSSLKHDINIKGYLEEIPLTQEGKLLTEEEKKEIAKLHQELKDYYDGNPEIRRRVEQVRGKLGELGFEDDPTPTGVLLRARMIEIISNLPTENIIEMASSGILTVEEIREYSEKLTGKKKQRLLAEAKETKYWQPMEKDEEVTLEMVKKTIKALLGDQSGHSIVEIVFQREESFEDSANHRDGLTGQDKKLELYIADNFKKADDNTFELLGKNSVLWGTLKDSKKGFEEAKNFWLRAREDEEIKKLLLAKLESAKALLEWADQVIKTYSEQKAGVVSRTLRHEIFGHLMDPLLYGFDFYSFEDELGSLELVTDDLTAHRELVRLPDDYQGERKERFLWLEVFDIPHTAWADIVTAATDHDWLAEDVKVSPEQLGLVNAILAKANLGLTVEEIKSVFHQAFKETAIKMEEDYMTELRYQELKGLYQEIEALGRQFIESGREESDLPLCFPVLGLLGLAWILRRRMQSK